MRGILIALLCQIVVALSVSTVLTVQAGRGWLGLALAALTAFVALCLTGALHNADEEV